MTGFSEYSDKPTLRVNFGPSFVYNKIAATACNENIVQRERKSTTGVQDSFYSSRKKADDEEKTVLVFQSCFNRRRLMKNRVTRQL
jgi:hypothetical protein